MGTLLVFADRIERRRWAMTVLARGGHRALEAASAEQAMAALLGRRVDLLLADLLMPQPGGYSFVCELHARRDIELPRMAFLAAPDMAAETELLARVSGFAGAVAELPDAAALLAAVDAALRQPPPARMRSAAPDRLYPLVSRLCSRVADLERSNARLAARMAMRSAQLDAARAALDREIARRLAIEERLAWRPALPVPTGAASA